MAVQVGRTVISFTIKYVQSEREKIKSDISKVLDAKTKTIKAAIKGLPEANKEMEQLGDNNNQNVGGGPGLGGYNQNFPLHMQQTQYAQQHNINMPMDAGEGDEGVDDVEDDINDNEPRQMNVD